MSVQAASAALAPASIGARVVAYIIDGLILFVVGLLVVGSLIGDQTVTGNVIRAIIYALLGFVYFGYTWTAWRASPGQRILGLVTVNADDGAAGPSAVQSLFTNQLTGGLGALIGLVVFVYYIYLLYSAATDSRRQGFHDKQAGTIVTTKASA